LLPPTVTIGWKKIAAQNDQLACNAAYNAPEI